MANHSGVCSICKKIGELSKDHIPPKSCGNSGKSLYISFMPEYLGDGANKRPKISQNGIKFKTICLKCNNDLGAKYDNDLALFQDFIIKNAKGTHSDKNPNIMNVIKGIIGHLLAASKLDECIPSEDMRKFYFCENEEIVKKFISDYSLLCFYYPYEDSIFILKDYISVDFTGRDKIPVGMISSFYFYPFAFIFCDKQKSFSSKDILELLSGGEITFSYKDWFYPNGTIRPQTWPAIGDIDGYVIITSGMAKDSVYKK